MDIYQLKEIDIEHKINLILWLIKLVEETEEFKQKITNLEEKSFDLIKKRSNYKKKLEDKE